MTEYHFMQTAPHLALEYSQWRFSLIVVDLTGEDQQQVQRTMAEAGINLTPFGDLFVYCSDTEVMSVIAVSIDIKMDVNNWIILHKPSSQWKSRFDGLHHSKTHLLWIRKNDAEPQTSTHVDCDVMPLGAHVPTIVQHIGPQIHSFVSCPQNETWLENIGGNLVAVAESDQFKIDALRAKYL